MFTIEKSIPLPKQPNRYDFYPVMDVMKPGERFLVDLDSNYENLKRISGAVSRRKAQKSLKYAFSVRSYGNRQISVTCTY